jgi:hypothetical protein
MNQIRFLLICTLRLKEIIGNRQCRFLVNTSTNDQNVCARQMLETVHQLFVDLGNCCVIFS